MQLNPVYSALIGFGFLASVFPGKMWIFTLLTHLSLRVKPNLTYYFWRKLYFPAWVETAGRLEMTCAPSAASSCDYAPCWPFCLDTLLLLRMFLFSVLSPLPLFSGQISLAPWGQMRRPSWLMCRVTTTRSQASRRWEIKTKKWPHTCQTGC